MRSFKDISSFLYMSCPEFIYYSTIKNKTERKSTIIYKHTQLI